MRVIWANRYDALARTWEGPVTLQATMSGFSGPVRLAMNPQGQAVAAWVHYEEGGPTEVSVSRYDTTTRVWGAIERVDSPVDSGGSAAASQGDVDLVVDIEGNVIVVWVGDFENDQGTNVHATRFAHATRMWSPAIRLDTTHTGTDGHPSPAVDRWGNAIVSFAQTDGLSMPKAWASRYDAACDTWSPAVQLDPTVASDRPVSTKSAIDDRGHGLVLFAQDDHLFASAYDVTTGTWTRTDKIDTTTSPAIDAALDVGAGGHGIAIWQQNFAGRQSVVVSHFDPTSLTWSEPTAIDTSLEDRSWTPQVEFDGQGRAIAAWSQLMTRRYKIRSNRFE